VKGAVFFMKKLWNKHWSMDKHVEAFETKDDLVWDKKLVWADAAGSIAHAMMLEKIGILTHKELLQAKAGLSTVVKLHQKKPIKLPDGTEDIHTYLEQYLTEAYGAVGKKIHTGRSRNDQVLTDIRLYTKLHLLEIQSQVLALSGLFCDFAQKYEHVPMPGYTHMQKAMPSSVGMWASSFAESLLDDQHVLAGAYSLVDQSPLGSAASYGVPLPIDRAYTAKLLGFGKIQNNSLYCQNSRGKVDAAVLSALTQVLLTVNKFATDVLLFTTSEFHYFTVADELTTGSSIMPQKRNIDIAELLRSKVHLMLGSYVGMISLVANLPSGYNRDFQDTKKPLMGSLELGKEVIDITTILLESLEPDKKALTAVMTLELYAAHEAFIRVGKGESFRDAHQEISVASDNSPVTMRDSERILLDTMHLGSTGNLQIQSTKKIIATDLAGCLYEKKQFYSALSRLGVEPVSTD